MNFNVIVFPNFFLILGIDGVKILFGLRVSEVVFALSQSF
jgi:hypothetical protein